jgi:hypothetical protein
MRTFSRALCSIGLLGILMSLDSSVANGCPADQAGGSAEATELSQEQQALLNHFYLLKEENLWKAIGLSPVQQVKMAIYDNKLDRLPVRFKSEGRTSNETVATLNTPHKQLERCMDLAEIVADTLSGEQGAAFRQAFKNRSYQPLEITLQPERITLVYRFGISGKVTRSTLGSNAKLGKNIRIAPSSSMVGMLHSFPDIGEAIFDEDETVRAVGIKALAALQVNHDDPKLESSIADLLLELARSKDLGTIKEEDLMKSLAKVVDASHERELLALARDASGTRLSALAAALCRASSDEAIAIARSRINDYQAFSSVLEGFVMYGSEAEPLLIKLNEITKEKRNILVQSALNRIGKPGTRHATRKASFQPRQMPLNRGSGKPSPSKSETKSTIENLSEWMKDLRSADYWERSNALDRYEQVKQGFSKTLSRSERAELVKLASERLEAESPSILSVKYGALLLNVADQGSIRRFEELASSSNKEVCAHGLAGLMKYSRKKAVETSLRIESTPLGIFTIVEAAKLVGPESVPVLKELKSKLEEWSSQRWVDGAIQDLE